MPNSSAGRYGPADDPGYPGFHTYATSDLYDTNGGPQRWPDNWSQSGEPPIDAYDDEDQPDPGRDYWAVLLWTICWYSLPALVLGIRALLIPEDTGARADALADFIANAPVWFVALTGGLILAVVLRWASDSWRAATIGFCAAVVSGGAVTVLYRIW